MNASLLAYFQTRRQEGYKALTLLLDPDKVDLEALPTLVELAETTGVDAWLVGGSLVADGHIHQLVPQLKALSRLPVVLFPGSIHQIEPAADAILLLSLISGRNPDLLIGQHVVAAPLLKRAGLEILPTGYLLIDGGRTTTAHYISNTQPIPHDKPGIAAATALAGQQLGLQLIYLDGGSGALKPVAPAMIRRVANEMEVPLMVGGGIRTAETARQAWEAGADILVIGTALEQEPAHELLYALQQVRQQLVPALGKLGHQ